MFLSRLVKSAIFIGIFAIVYAIVILVKYIITHFEFLQTIWVFTVTYIVIPIMLLGIIVGIILSLNEFVHWQIIEPYRAWKKDRKA